MFSQSPLPYATDALEPYISKRTMELHYGKHHKGYIDKLNNEMEKSGHDKSGNADLVELLQTSEGQVFNLAAQVWNHAFFWQCLSPTGGGEPPPELSKALQAEFESVDGFFERFKEAASGEFGSGWAWLVYRDDKSLAVVSTTDAETPLQQNHTPLLTLDVWEHAYYLDYQNRRPEYIDAFCDHMINWQFVQENLVCAQEEARAA